MPKPDPALLDPARYPFRYSVEPRFGDLDVNMHITNVALMELAQEGRVRFNQASGYRSSLAGATTMVASFAIEFLGETFYPDTLEVHSALSQVGRTSQTIDQIMSQRGRVVAWARAVIVHIEDGRPAELPRGFRESAKAWMLKA